MVLVVIKILQIFKCVNIPGPFLHSMFLDRLHSMFCKRYLDQQQFEFKDICAQGCPFVINEWTRHISLTHIWQWAWHLFAFVAFCFCLWTRDAGAAIKLRSMPFGSPWQNRLYLRLYLGQNPKSCTQSPGLMNWANYLSSQLAHRC